MTQSTNPFDTPSIDSSTTELQFVRPKGEIAYIITCLVLTVLWAFALVANHFFYLIGWIPIESDRYMQWVVVPGWIILFLVGIPSLISVYRWRLDPVATIVQIIVLTLLCYTIPFAIWGAVQLYYARAHDSKARSAQS